MTTVAVLGSTGSIGTQTLDVVANQPDDFEIVALGAGRDARLLAEQANRHRPQVVGLADAGAVAELRRLLDPGIEVVVGVDELAELAPLAEVTVNGVVGFAGLPVTLATLRAGKRLALANKESLIAAGPVVRTARETPGAELIPVDSEHCAIHQCLRANDDDRRLGRVVLTASGGPFRGRTAAELETVDVTEALQHPTWSMGPKITVDSSTLMNKGLEVIEAHELFSVGYDHIDVVVHPQSIVHSMAEFSDGTTIAQLSLPDMRLPIGYALAHPDRITTPFGRMDWSAPIQLDFEPPDRETFGCLDLAYRAGRLGGTAPAWLSAANEVAVDAFLDGRIGWAAIARLVADALEQWDGSSAGSVEDVLAADEAGRRRATELLTRHGSERVGGATG